MAKPSDLTGQRFGKLVVISRAENNHRGNTQWLCKCDCGKCKIALGYDLTHHRTISCGCNLVGTTAHNRKDLTGKKYGDLTVVELAESKNGCLIWKCRCVCGQEKYIRGSNLKSGQGINCNHHKKIKAKKITPIRQGDSSANSKYCRLYREWNSMNNRCSPYYHGHHRYFDRGIRVCEEWKDYFVFKAWALENGYSDNLTLDRIDNNGDYEPNNCRWATLKEQANNTSQNVMITYQGKTQTLKQWSEELNLSYGMLKARRRYGWENERLFAPKQ